MTHFTIGFNGLPFIPDEKQIIYVENAYDKKVNRFIKRHHKRICRHFARCGYEFCYLPLLHKKLNKEVQTYYNPASKRQTMPPIGSDFLLQFMAHPENRDKIKPSLLYVHNSVEVLEGEDLVLRSIELENLDWRDRKLANILATIRADRRTLARKMTEEPAEEDRSSEQIPEAQLDEGVRFSIRLNKEYCDYYRISDELLDDDLLSDDFFGDKIWNADEQFDKETQKLLGEVMEKIGALKQRGVSLYVLEQMLQEPAKPSRMVITSDYRILLPDYQNMEIEMTPLVKAVYVLFLRHPEGIIFKHLPDYQAELMDIYKKIKGEPLDEKMIRSVMDVTCPIKNSINEKCARIREAFVSRFDERLAINYIVRGERGAPKLISLPRELVEWQ